MRNLAHNISRTPVRNWLSLGLSGAMLTMAVAALVPSKAMAAAARSTSCSCASTTCQASGGSYFQRWCCRDGYCGCTLFTNC